MTVEELGDEICAIEAIYEGSVSKVAPQIINFSLPSHEDLILQLSFPTAYPDEPPTVVQVAVKDARKYTDQNYIENHVKEVLTQIFRVGEVCIYELFNELEPFLDGCKKEPVLENEIDKMMEKLEIEEKPIPIAKFEVSKADVTSGWIQSEPLSDRGSTFVAFVREVHDVEEAKELFDTLISDRKIARSSHNMSSWRIRGDNGVQYQDFDDDGETAAGGRLLHLLTMMDAWNLIVVVSRWFGGTHIGPDRFKHINTVAREAVIKSGLTNVNTNAKKKKK